MNRMFIRALMTGGLLVAVSLTLPSGARAQQRSGVEIWDASCGRCHLIQPTNKYEAKDWRSIGIHMGITARLTSAQREAVIAFLVSGARPVGGQAALPAPLVPTLTQEQVAELARYLASTAAATPVPMRTSSR